MIRHLSTWSWIVLWSCYCFVLQHVNLFLFFFLFSCLSLLLMPDITDLEAPVPILPPGLPGRLHGCLWVQTGIQQEVAEYGASHDRACPVLQCAQRCSGCHGSHIDPATAANSRSDCLQVLESDIPLTFKYRREGRGKCIKKFGRVFFKIRQLSERTGQKGTQRMITNTKKQKKASAGAKLMSVLCL